MRDSDIPAEASLEKDFRGAGGVVFPWREGRALEDELFLSLSDNGVEALLDKAIHIKEESIVNEHIRSASGNTEDLNSIKMAVVLDTLTPEMRAHVGAAARVKNAWFKNVTDTQAVAHEIVGPDLENADDEFVAIVDQLFEWIADDG